MVSGTLMKQHIASHAYMLCASARLVLIQWTDVSFVDLGADCLLLWLFEQSRDPVVDVTIKSLVLSLLLWFSPTSLDSLLIMWPLIIFYTWNHQYVFSMGPFVVCDAFSYSLCQLTSHKCYWDLSMSMWAFVGSWYFGPSLATALQLGCFCGLMGIWFWMHHLQDALYSFVTS